MKIYLSCPHCKNRLGVLRKLFFLSTRHDYECPYCHTKLRRKGLGTAQMCFISAGSLLNIILYPRYITRVGFAHINFFLIAVLMVFGLFLPILISNDDQDQ